MSVRRKGVFASVDEPTWDPDEFAELGDELRRGAGTEFLAEAAEIEQETHLLRRRRRRLGDVATELVQRGDLVGFRLGDRAVTGVAVFAGADYLTVATGTTEATVRLDAVALSVRRRRAGGRPTAGGATTFKARLAEFALTGELLTLVAPTLGLDVAGHIDVVAVDHVLVRDLEEVEWLIPLATLTLILREIPSSPSH